MAAKPKPNSACSSKKPSAASPNIRARASSIGTDQNLHLAKEIAALSGDPFRHALMAYPWGEGALAGAHGPRAWQCAVMEAIRKHLADPATRFTPCRIARASGHGIGKSALIAMLVKWGLDTAVDTRTLLTANTESQLLTKTAPEIAKWSDLSLTRGYFRTTATAMVSTSPGKERSWRADLVTWSLANTDAFAGLHNQGKRLILIFDEASGIPAKIWEVALGALTDAETEILFLVFGNPTQATGAFRDCFGRHRHLWNTEQIDSRTVEGVNRAYLQEVWFGGRGRDALWAGQMPVRTANKRTEMWTNMRGWLEGGAIPDDEMLAADLTGVEYGYAADQVSILLEKKEHMKARGLASPDDADALALTFAEPVMPRDLIEYLHPTRYTRPDEDEDDLYRDLRSDEDLYRDLRDAD